MSKVYPIIVERPVIRTGSDHTKVVKIVFTNSWCSGRTGRDKKTGWPGVMTGKGVMFRTSKHNMVQFPRMPVVLCVRTTSLVVSEGIL